MRLQRIEIRNFRCFVDFSLDVDGRSLLLIAPNAGGKTSFLTAVRMALRGATTLASEDLADLDLPLEIIATLSDIPPAAHAAFAGAMTFTQPPTLRVGVRATWDKTEAELEQVFGFPDDGWKRAGRDARENLPLLWLPAWRDTSKLLPFTGSASLLDELVKTLDIDAPLDVALAAITAAGDQLAHATAIKQMLVALRDELAALLPNVSTDAYSLGVNVAQPRDLLRQFELMLTHDGPAAPVLRQSEGLGQLTIFVLALRLLATSPAGLLLVDEPEQALHPHAQRALLQAVRDRAGQSLIATHSPSVLDREDPRHITRLRRAVGGDVEAVSARRVSDQNARRLARHSTAQTAEAFFAETVIVFEGVSDLLAFREFARRSAVNLDATGVTLLSLDGADLFPVYLELLGPGGMDLRVLGQCDADREARWTATLNTVGYSVVDRASLSAAGVEVCDPDLEAELVSALSVTEVEQVIDADGELPRFQRFAAQPANSALPVSDQQLRFIKADKVRWAPLLASRIDASHIPLPIQHLLARI